MRRSVVLSCLLLVLPSGSSAQIDESDVARALETYVGAHVANGDFSGVVLVTREGRTLYQKSVGLGGSVVSPKTRFPVASVTKTFTAALIAILQEEGKLETSDPLERYVPELALAGRIRLVDLLAHRSGLAEPGHEGAEDRSVTPDELLGLIDAQPPLFEPGTQTRYSNAGYIALARVAERVGGAGFGELLKQRIFAPLAMEDCGVLAPSVVVPRLATGHLPGVGLEVVSAPTVEPSWLFGSGNVFATAADLDRWLTAIDGNALFDIRALAYPFGWGVRSWFGRDVLVQSGIIPGFSSVVLTVPEERLHIVVLLDVQSGFTGDEGKTLLGILTGAPADPPAPRGAPASVPDSLLGRYAGLYLWGEPKIPMHVEKEARGLTLRWGDSKSGVLLTPLGPTEFLDRTSFGRIRFEEDGLVWIQDGRETPASRSSR